MQSYCLSELQVKKKLRKTKWRKTMKKILITAIILVIFAFAFTDIYAQYAYTLDGVVTQNGNPVSEATVRLDFTRSTFGADHVTTTTDSKGYYRISIPATHQSETLIGDVTLTASKPPDRRTVTFSSTLLGFHHTYSRNIDLNIAEIIKLPFFDIIK
jgi:hypothetical protein